MRRPRRATGSVLPSGQWILSVFLIKTPCGTPGAPRICWEDGGKRMQQPRSEVRRHPNPSVQASEEAAAAALTVQLLDFVAAGRTYGETMDAWRSTCPRMPIWEDAVREGLVRVENGGAMKSSRIVLTVRGKARLAKNKT